MQKVKIFGLFLISLLFLNCCSGNNSENQEIGGQTLLSLVDSALKGSLAANKRLSGLVDANKVIQQSYNRLTIDSSIVSGIKYFSILVEYPNPNLNLLAVYDSYLNFYLLDKSLNGNLAEEWKAFGKEHLLFISEKFISKDLLKIGRNSVYGLKDSKWNLVFRYFTSFEIDQKLYTQEIQSFNDKKIETVIKSNDKNLTDSDDIFTFNESTGKFISDRNIFDNYVKKQIADFNWIPEKPELTSSKNESTKSGVHKSDYNLSVSSGWKEIDDMTLTSKFHQDLFGDRYVNPNLGASISIANIDYVSSAEDYCKFSFKIQRSVNYVIRDTGLLEQNIYVVRIMEHSCNQKKYLLIFECSKYVYEKNKSQIDTILSSFSIRC
jgi:hypothetical protein